MKIEAYRFGQMVIDGVPYDKDLLLSNDQIFPEWWRKEGHRLFWQDLESILAIVQPTVVVVGQGKFGMMRISPEVKEELAGRGIGLVAGRTDKAVEEFNRLVNGNKILGAFHLTC